MRFTLSELLPKEKSADPDVWQRKLYEVLDPLATWQWVRGMPVCVTCRPGDPKWRGTVVDTLRADRESCSCNCASRRMEFVSEEEAAV